MYVLLYKLKPQSRWLVYEQLFDIRSAAENFGRSSMGRGVWSKVHVSYVEMP